MYETGFVFGSYYPGLPKKYYILYSNLCLNNNSNVYTII